MSAYPRLVVAEMGILVVQGMWLGAGLEPLEKKSGRLCDK